jgi:hypothetical protein
MDIPILPLIQIVGPSNNPYPGTMCFPNVSVPADTGVKVGDNATIQVILTAQHGASLFSVGIPFCQNLNYLLMFQTVYKDKAGIEYEDEQEKEIN